MENKQIAIVNPIAGGREIQRCIRGLFVRDRTGSSSRCFWSNHYSCRMDRAMRPVSADRFNLLRPCSRREPFHCTGGSKSYGLILRLAEIVTLDGKGIAVISASAPSKPNSVTKFRLLRRVSL